MHMFNPGCASCTDEARVRSLLARRAAIEASWLARLSQPPANARPAEPAPGEGEVEALRRRRIEEAAYFRAERRGFAPGFELVDWLEAEAEVDAER
jgi:hypothetical protein